MITVTRHCLSNESGDLKSLLFFMIQRFPNFICLNLHGLQNLQDLQDWQDLQQLQVCCNQLLGLAKLP